MAQCFMLHPKYRYNMKHGKKGESSLQSKPFMRGTRRPLLESACYLDVMFMDIVSVLLVTQNKYVNGDVCLFFPISMLVLRRWFRKYRR